jgi:hypothetical protein
MAAPAVHRDRSVGPATSVETGTAWGLSDRLTGLPELGVFTALVALLAILADASIGHAMMWENDPYWTYWITKTFLIATVFGLGTAWFGAGVGRGAVITAVHTLVLTVYYWTLSPIGLPSQPNWLDLEHTWVTGLPVHFGVIYLGYLTALWLWRRRPSMRAMELDDGRIGMTATHALATSVGIVAVAGLLESLALQDFPGVTWFVVRLLITVPFTLLWWAAAGRDRTAAIGGGITLALILITYSHFLGPVGLPNSSLRILAQDPPPANVHWLDYRQEFLVALPITAVVAIVGYLLSSRWAHRGESTRPAGSTLALFTVAVAVLIGLGVVAAYNTGPSADRATVTSSGTASLEQGAYYQGELRPSTGELRLVAENRNPRVTPLPPHDRVDLNATVTGADGTSYEITSTQPMIDDPLGRFGTWWGVGFDEWNHGRSGVGTDLIPPTRSNVAIFALAQLTANGELMGNAVPVHVMTMAHEMGRLEMDVGDPTAPLPGVPDGHLRVIWSDFDGGHSHGGSNARYALGAAVLIILLLLTLATIRKERAGIESR